MPERCRQWRAWGVSPMISALVVICLAAQVVGAAEMGTITGIVDKPKLVKTVAAIDRDSGKKYAGKLDTKTGRFTIDGLPLKGQYDCLIDFGKARLEGVNLKVPRSDYEEE